MGNVYVAWLYNTAERMALEVFPRLSQGGDIKQVRLDFWGNGWCVAHATTPFFASIRIRAMLAAMGLTRVSSARQGRQEITQMSQDLLFFGNWRAR